MPIRVTSQMAAHESAQAPRQPTDDNEIEALAQRARKRLLLLQLLAERERSGLPSAENDDGGRVFWDELELMRHDWCDTNRQHFMNCRMRDEVDVKNFSKVSGQLNDDEVPTVELDNRHHAEFAGKRESIVIDDISSALASMTVQLTSHLDKLEIEGGGSVSRVFTSHTRAYLLEHIPAGGLLYLERGIDGVDYLLVISKWSTDGRILLRTLQK